MARKDYDDRFEHKNGKSYFIDPEERKEWLTQRQAMCVVQKWKCYYCGNPLQKKMHMDHKQPVSRGGTDDPENLCMTCPDCNLTKSAMTEYEFKSWKGWLTPEETAVIVECPLQQGSRIVHETFGRGIVIATKVRDKDTEVDIKFDEQKGIKRISWNIAHAISTIEG